MRKIEPTIKFKKDYKRLKKQPFYNTAFEFNITQNWYAQRLILKWLGMRKNSLLTTHPSPLTKIKLICTKSNNKFAFSFASPAGFYGKNKFIIRNK